jgi:hypothetical protein
MAGIIRNPDRNQHLVGVDHNLVKLIAGAVFLSRRPALGYGCNFGHRRRFRGRGLFSRRIGRWWCVARWRGRGRLAFRGRRRIAKRLRRFHRRGSIRNVLFLLRLRLPSLRLPPCRGGHQANCEYRLRSRRPAIPFWNHPVILRAWRRHFLYSPQISRLLDASKLSRE